MNVRPWLIILATVILGGLILNLNLSRPAAGQSSEAPAVQAGRYQFVVVPGNPNTLFVFEPGTGQCWSRTTAGQEWRDYGSPAIKVQK